MSVLERVLANTSSLPRSNTQTDASHLQSSCDWLRLYMKDENVDASVHALLAKPFIITGDINEKMWKISTMATWIYVLNS